MRAADHNSNLPLRSRATAEVLLREQIDQRDKRVQEAEDHAFHSFRLRSVFAVYSAINCLTVPVLWNDTSPF